jgi:hypothetical protein
MLRLTKAYLKRELITTSKTDFIVLRTGHGYVANVHCKPAHVYVGLNNI